MPNAERSPKSENRIGMPAGIGPLYAGRNNIFFRLGHTADRLPFRSDAFVMSWGFVIWISFVIRHLALSDRPKGEGIVCAAADGE